ncbi:MAG: hypothetical protein ABI649_10710 [Gaiellaceae bacterium]
MEVVAYDRAFVEREEVAGPVWVIYTDEGDYLQHWATTFLGDSEMKAFYWNVWNALKDAERWVRSEQLAALSDGRRRVRKLSGWELISDRWFEFRLRKRYDSPATREFMELLGGVEVRVDGGGRLLPRKTAVTSDDALT